MTRWGWFARRSGWRLGAQLDTDSPVFANHATKARSHAAGVAVMILALVACGGIPSGAETLAPPTTQSGSGTPLPTLDVTWRVDGRTLLVHVEASGIDVRFVPGDRSGDTGHLHLFVDRAPPAAGEPIGFEPGIVHADGRDLRASGLAPGSHTVWVVVADGADLALDPLVATRLMFIIE